MLRTTTLKPGKPLQRGKPMNRSSCIKSGTKPTTTASKKRSTLKPSRPQPSADESRHMARVAALGCICCLHCYGIEGTPAIVHHLRTGQGKMRASHYNTLPLCPWHHQDSGEGIHDMGRQQFADLHGASEVELLHLVQQYLGVPLWMSSYPESDRSPLKQRATL